MGWMSKVGELLQQYDTSNATRAAEASRPEEEVQNHFAKVADAAPRSEMSGGIAQAFRSNTTPPFEDMVSKLFASSDPSQKAGLLNIFMPRPGTPLDKLVQKMGINPSSTQTEVTPEQASKIDPETVRTLASEAERSDPSVMDRAGDFYAQHPSLVKNLGGAALAVALAHLARNTRSM